MKKTILVIGLIFVLSACGVNGALASDASLIYHLYVDGSVARELIAESIVQFKEISTDQTTLSRQKQRDNSIVYDEFVLDKEYSVEKWTRTNIAEDTQFVSERKEETLVVKGKLKGKSIDREIDLGKKPLYIYPEFNLVKFVLSDMRKIKFWTFRRDSMKKLPMQAIKKGEKEIVVNGKRVQAIEVYYSITGKMREKHYRHNYYYRKSDGMLLKREEQNGRVEELVKEE